MLTAELVTVVRTMDALDRQGCQRNALLVGSGSGKYGVGGSEGVGAPAVAGRDYGRREVRVGRRRVVRRHAG